VEAEVLDSQGLRDDDSLYRVSHTVARHAVDIVLREARIFEGVRHGTKRQGEGAHARVLRELGESDAGNGGLVA
jgi:hypothetical protein